MNKYDDADVKALIEIGIAGVQQRYDHLCERIEAICEERSTPPKTRSQLRHALAGVDWKKVK